VTDACSLTESTSPDSLTVGQCKVLRVGTRVLITVRCKAQAYSTVTTHLAWLR